MKRHFLYLVVSPFIGCFSPDTTGDPSAGEAATEGTGGGSADATSASGMDGKTTGATTGTDTGDTETGNVASCDTGDACVVAPPEGWAGPAALAKVATVADLPDCSGAFSAADTVGYEGPDWAPGECTACSCGAPSGVECAPPDVRFFGSSSCDYLAYEATLLGDGACTVFVQPTGNYGANSDAVDPVAGTGTCVSMGGELVAEEPSWAATVGACALSDEQNSCGEGMMCVPEVPHAFNLGLCIYRSGDTPCPAGPYQARTLLHQSIDDTRACSDCECGEPVGVSCDARIDFYSDASCSESYVTLESPGQQCLGLWGAAPTSGMLVVENLVGGGCAPGGGQAVGEIVPREAMTVCCLE